MSPLSIIICILGLGILAAVHEIGHFIVARILKIKVYELSVFVGPKLFSWKRNGIDYFIRLIPVGAYVRFSEIDEETGELKDDNPENLINQARWKRLLVSLAGPFMNIILGIIIFMICFSVFGFLSLRQGVIVEGTQVADTRIEVGDSIVSLNGRSILCQMDLSYYLDECSNKDSVDLVMRSGKTGEKYNVTLVPDIQDQYMLGFTHYSGVDSYGGWKVTSVDSRQNNDSPVMKVNDTVLSVNDVPVTDPACTDIIRQSNGQTLSVKIVRNGEEMTLEMNPIKVKTSNLRGIYLDDGKGLWETFREAVVFPFSFIRISIDSLAKVFAGKVAAYDVLSGPVGIASVVSDVVDAPEVESSMKVETLLILAGGISTGLAFTNLLPIPGLDGNAIVLTVVEMIRGKKLSRKAEQVINVIGFVMIIGLVIFALVSDIIRLSR
ncbi:MAG: RIP metalloprotease RseP [Lachnospiraceae bacterium]|nr:RIP metalloprotease RseP [Clostridiales bacterium]MBR6849606.1 RIP metalloprotease RseP [Lachnospiraceae bacterium]